MHRAARKLTNEQSTAVAAAVIITAAALRFLDLGRLGLWWDEGWSIYFAGLPVRQMLEATSLDIHPPLYYFLLHLWAQVLGFAPAAARAFSALASVAVVIGGWALARRLLGARTALVAGLLLALAPAQVFHAQEARMYALSAALALASWLALLSREEALRRRSLHTAAYGLITAAALYTEYYASLLWLGQVAYLIVRTGGGSPAARLRQRSWTLLPVLLHLPWIVWAGPRLIGYVAQKQGIEGYGAVDPLTYLWQHVSAFAGGHTLPGQSALLPGLAAALLVTLAFIGWRALRGDRRSQWVLVGLGAIPFALAYLVHLAFPFTPSFYQRILLPFATPLYLLAAHGLVEGFRRPAVRAAFAGAALLLPALNLGPTLSVVRYAATDYRPLFELIRQSGSPDDRVLCVHPWQYGYAVSYLPRRSGLPVLAPTDRWRRTDERAGELSALLERSRVVWFPSHESLGRILESQIANDLAESASQAYARWYDDDTLLLAYAGRAPDLLPGATGEFTGGPALLASSHSTSVSSGTGVVQVRLNWRSPMGEGYGASLRLVDHSGKVWAASDLEITGAVQHRALLVPWGTPAVTLDLTLTLSHNGQELLPEGHESSMRSLTLGSVSVLPSEVEAPPPEDLGLKRIDAGFENGLRLVGAAPWPERFAQGDLVPVQSLWKSDADIPSEPVLFIQALDRDGRPVAATETRITSGTWPPTAWPNGSFVGDRHALLLPADTAPGRLTIIAGLLDPTSRERYRWQESREVTLGTIEVASAERLLERPNVAAVAPVAFGDLAILDGFELSPCPDLAAGCVGRTDELTVRLLWRATSTTAVRYLSFVHLTCGADILAQSDREPGDTKSTAWLPGQYIDDSHHLPAAGIPACPGGLSLQVGLYDPLTQQRLPPDSPLAEEGRLPLVRQESR